MKKLCFFERERSSLLQVTVCVLSFLFSFFRPFHLKGELA